MNLGQSISEIAAYFFPFLIPFSAPSSFSFEFHLSSGSMHVDFTELHSLFPISGYDQLFPQF